MGGGWEVAFSVGLGWDEARARQAADIVANQQTRASGTAACLQLSGGKVAEIDSGVARVSLVRDW